MWFRHLQHVYFLCEGFAVLVGSLKHDSLKTLLSTMTWVRQSTNSYADQKRPSYQGSVVVGKADMMPKELKMIQVAKEVKGEWDALINASKILV